MDSSRYNHPVWAAFFNAIPRSDAGKALLFNRKARIADAAFLQWKIEMGDWPSWPMPPGGLADANNDAPSCAF